MKLTRIVICIWALIYPAVATASSQNLQEITYRISTSMRTIDNMLILEIIINPEDFNRDRMRMLARQLNRDFPNELRIYAVFFDSEETAHNYNPAGGSYYISKKLERGEYELDRVRGREVINFSSRRGKPVDEIKIVLNKRFNRVRRRKEHDDGAFFHTFHNAPNNSFNRSAS